MVLYIHLDVSMDEISEADVVQLKSDLATFISSDDVELTVEMYTEQLHISSRRRQQARLAVLRVKMQCGSSAKCSQISADLRSQIAEQAKPLRPSAVAAMARLIEAEHAAARGMGLCASPQCSAEELARWAEDQVLPPDAAAARIPYGILVMAY